MTLLREDNDKLAFGLSWTLSYVPFAFVDFNIYTFVLINCNHESNSFYEL